MKLDTAIIEVETPPSAASCIVPRPIRFRGLLKHPGFPREITTTYPVACLPALDAPLCVVPAWLIKGLSLPEVGVVRNMHWPRIPKMGAMQTVYEVLIELKESGVAERVLAIGSPVDHDPRDPDTEVVLLGMSFFNRVLLIISGKDRYALLERQS